MSAIVRSRVALSLSLINNDSSTVRLAGWLRSEVRRLAPGERLPSTRSLVETQQVSPVTVSRALAMLAGEGLVVTRPGAGTFVAQRAGRSDAADMSWQAVILGERSINADGISPLADPPGADNLISLASGYPHASLMPVRALTSALNHAARDPRAWDRPPTAGLASLRAWFARSAGPGTCDARDVVVTSGGQAAITAALRALLRPGEPLLVESPTYPGVLAAARLEGIRVLPVPVDEHGVIPGLLAEAFGRSGARVFYCQPTYHNPTGAVLTEDRRVEVLAIAEAAQAFIIEDDACRWLSHGSRSPRSLLADDHDGRVVYLTSLTKTASPSLRVGALIARGPVASRLHAIRVVDDMFVARPLQEAALDLLTRPAWERHLHELGRELSHRATVLARDLSSFLPAVRFLPPAGGVHLWARLPPGTDDIEVASAARQAGVIVMPGQPFFPAEPSAPHLRLTFSAASSETQLRSGVQCLAAAAPALRGLLSGFIGNLRDADRVLRVMMLKRRVVTLAALAACAFAVTAPADAAVSAGQLPAGLLPMATSWQSPSSGIVLAYPSRGPGAKPYLLETGNAGRTWRSLPAPPVTYPADNDQPDAIWTGDVIAVTDGTHIVLTQGSGRHWSAERVPSGFYVDKLVITSGRLFALLVSDTSAAVYSGPLGGGVLRAVRGLSVSGSLTYGDITDVGTLQVDLGSGYTTQRYWYSRDGVHFVSARLPCPATTSALLGGVRSGHVIALCVADPSQVGPGETDVQPWIAAGLGDAFHASGPVTDSPDVLEFAAASARDMTVATIFDLSVTHNAGQTWAAALVQNNGATWSDLSFSTATAGTVVSSTVDNEGNEVSTVYRTTNAGRTWGTVKLP